MKRITLYLLLICICWNTALSQTGKVFDNLSLPSKVLNMERKYAVYLPPGYETSERSYPVLYLLHGAAMTRQDGCSLGKYYTLPTKLSRMENQPQ